MNKRQGASRFRIVLVAIMCVTAAIFAGLNIYRAVSKNISEYSAKKLIEASLSDSSDKMSLSLEKALNLPNLGSETKGDLYHNLALRVYLSDNKTRYNEYIGYAAFCYKKCGNDEKLAALLSEYMGRMYENAGFEACGQVLEYLKSAVNIDSLHSNKTKAAFYLGYADVEQMNGKLKESEKNLLSAAGYLEKLKFEDENNYELQAAKYDLLSARLELMRGNLNHSMFLMLKYDGTENFGYGENNLYVICDFLIPYYELKAKLALENNELEDAYRYTDMYAELCEKSSFHVMELRMYRYMLSHRELVNVDKLEDYEKKTIELSENTLDYFSAQYCDLLLNNMFNICDEEGAKSARADLQKTVVNFAFAVFLMMLLLLILSESLLSKNNTDPLTTLETRHMYDLSRIRLEKKKSSYYLLILDIDDFKKVNDTYGHDTGDKVLRFVGKTILECIPAGCSAFRFGGEEFCVTMVNKDFKESLELAEKIRLAVSEGIIDENVRVTVSGGLAKATGGVSPFHEADKCLYDSKANGKNQITFAVNEEKELQK